MRTVGVVLAAGAGTRFGSLKMLAPLGGQPLLQHVLDALSVAGIADVVVVLGGDAAELEAAIEWRDELRIVNH
ncbi:MAG: NTP transferase domain-containing protein, partial [Chloroflexota bacterium]